MSNDDTIKNSSIKPSQSFICQEKIVFLTLIFLLSLGIDRLALNDHAAMAIDFKGEGFQLFNSFIIHTNDFYLALTFKATTDGVIHNIAFCMELMQKREDVWRKKYEKVNIKENIFI